nr:hypothetical protein [Kribbella sandramycini]
MELARLYYPAGEVKGGEARATVDFRSRKSVVFRDFKVRDVCPGDDLPVRGRVEWVHADGTRGVGSWKADTNGCGVDGTNFGDIRRTDTKVIVEVMLTVCVYRQSGGNIRCHTSGGRANPYV